MAERLRQGFAQRLMPEQRGGCAIGGIATARASGIDSSMMMPQATSACCQPKPPMKATASGENRNWPKEPAAVPAPKARDAYAAASTG